MAPNGKGGKGKGAKGAAAGPSTPAQKEQNVNAESKGSDANIDTDSTSPPRAAADASDEGKGEHGEGEERDEGDVPLDRRVAELEEELAIARQEKETLGNQYRSLLAKLTAMRQSLGDKLREDAVSRRCRAAQARGDEPSAISQDETLTTGRARPTRNNNTYPPIRERCPLRNPRERTWGTSQRLYRVRLSQRTAGTTPLSVGLVVFRRPIVDARDEGAAGRDGAIEDGEGGMGSGSGEGATTAGGGRRGDD